MTTTDALRFAPDLINRIGDCSTVELREFRYRDEEIVEILAQVQLNVTIAQTELDSPIEIPEVVAA